MVMSAQRSLFVFITEFVKVYVRRLTDLAWEPNQSTAQIIWNDWKWCFVESLWDTEAVKLIRLWERKEELMDLWKSCDLFEISNCFYILRPDSQTETWFKESNLSTLQIKKNKKNKTQAKCAAPVGVSHNSAIGVMMYSGALQFRNWKTSKIHSKALKMFS